MSICLMESREGGRQAASVRLGIILSFCNAALSSLCTVAICTHKWHVAATSTAYRPCNVMAIRRNQ